HWNSSALVMNCDILTTVDYVKLFRLHSESDSMLTVATHVRHLPADFGVLDIAEDGRVLGISEKPRMVVDTSSGIYVMSPELRRYLSATAPMDVPDLIATLIKESRPVRAFRFT